MKNVRVKVRKFTCTNTFDYGIYEGKKRLMDNRFHRSGDYSCREWQIKAAAIRNAKAMAKRIGIPYDPEIVKQHGC